MRVLFQCAYCTSGMIMSSVGLLQTNPNPSQAEIVQFLQGNVCRCGTHPAASSRRSAKAAKTMPGARAMSNADGKIVHRGRKRYEFSAAPFHQFELAAPRLF